MGVDILETLAEALAPALEQRKARQYGLSQKHDISGTPSANIYAHGPNGLLTFPGVDNQVFHTVMGAESIISEIPIRPSQYTNPTYFTLTGVADETGAEMNGVCDNAPVGGLMQGCLTTSVFGRYERATNLIDLGRLGSANDRADPMDLRLVGTPYGADTPFMGLTGGSPADVLTNEVSRRFWEKAIAFHRMLSLQFWQGNPVNSTGAGGYKEMTGLSMLVNTGYHDAETGAACSAQDSYVRDFGNRRVDSSGTNLVAEITNMYHQVKRRAQRSGVMPVRWALAMKSGLFYELTAIWPCAYLSYRCATEIQALDPQDAVRMRDEMRSGNYLLIDGDRVNVLTDDGIDERNGNESGAFARGCFSTDIYLLPMSVVGGTSVLYMEYLQYNNGAIADAFAQGALGTVNGAWITWPRQTNLCVQWQSRIEPRLVLRTPWLAARLNNVVYCPIEHEIEPFPDDPYFKGGGRTSRTGPSYFQLWGGA